jgi:hypothetical protein
VFVCHSLGGLVVQRLLLTFRQYAQQVPFIYFFSTPETGSQIANLGSVFSSDPLLKVMFAGDENGYLQNLENEWKAAQFHIHRLCAYEKKKYKGVLVVDRLSGTRNCDEPPMAINEDHLGIVKPNGTEHDSYIALRNAMRRPRTQAASRPPPITKADKGPLQDVLERWKIPGNRFSLMPNDDLCREADGLAETMRKADKDTSNSVINERENYSRTMASNEPSWVKDPALTRMEAHINNLYGQLLLAWVSRYKPDGVLLLKAMEPRLPAGTTVSQITLRYEWRGADESTSLLPMLAGDLDKLATALETGKAPLNN